MNAGNLVFILIGAFVTFTGILSFINPNWTRWINFPGGPRLKAIAALVSGLILLLVGLLIKIPAR